MLTRRHTLRGWILALSVAVAASIAVPTPAAAVPGVLTDVWRTAVPRADCGPGSAPEPGLQGEVPLQARERGRNHSDYRCNIRVVGKYQGDGAGIVSPTYEHCSYTGSNVVGLVGPRPGVQVLDVSDPAHPRLSTTLTEPAMLAGTWESLKVNSKRGLLAGLAVGLETGIGYFSIYDIARDCAHPRLLNTGPGSQLTMPLPIASHEGGFSPDGKTYWAASASPGLLFAIDVSDPAHPRVVWSGPTGLGNHGFGISDDGNRMYMSTLAGITILDISSVQRRDPYPVVPHLSTVSWLDGQLNQHSIPVSVRDHRYLLTVDEAGSGGVKVFDIANERAPRLINTIKLEINLPQHMDRWARSASGESLFGYDAHYCSVDRPHDPTTLACGWIQSGIRVFDIRNLRQVREIAYYNPPANVGKAPQLLNSLHATVGQLASPPATGAIAIARAIVEGDIRAQDAVSPRLRLIGVDLSADWCMSPPEFHGTQLWVSCSDNGFMVLQLENGVYPPR